MQALLGVKSLSNKAAVRVYSNKSNCYQMFFLNTCAMTNEVVGVTFRLIACVLNKSINVASWIFCSLNAFLVIV